MSRVAFVTCSSAKAAVRSAPAGQLYTSALFLKSRRWAEQNCDRWYILSAKYGLLEPTQVIEQYNVSLNTLGKTERQDWGKRVLTALAERVAPGDELTFLAGAKYREFLESALRQRGYDVRVPLEGMRIGEQLQWLDRHTR